MSGAGVPAGRPRVALAGASGGIGSAVLRALAHEHELVALTRSPARSRHRDPDLPVEWRLCDLFARSDVEAALGGCRHVVYLVHSRLPSARLDQAQCADMDLLIADNFGRGAARAGVEQIVCLRGPAPGADLAPGGRERLEEVTDALGAHGVPVTVIHAGVVVAPGGTVMTLFAHLATRLPWVPVPRWALRRWQPIALADLARAVRRCVGDPAALGRRFTVGGPAVVDLREFLEATARALGRRPRFIVVDRCPRWLFRWWLRLMSPTSHPTLVRAAVDHMARDSLADDSELQRFLDTGAVPLEAALETIVAGSDRRLAVNPRHDHRDQDDAWLREARTVRSIQRYRCPPGHGAPWLAETYFRWLPRFVWPFVVCEEDDEGTLCIAARFPHIRLLELAPQPDHGDPGRVLYFIVGGLLASRRAGTHGRMEFHDVLDGRHTIVAIHDFEPFLPWNFYHATQATAHGIVMRAFERHLSRRGPAA